MLGLVREQPARAVEQEASLRHRTIRRIGLRVAEGFRTGDSVDCCSSMTKLVTFFHLYQHSKDVVSNSLR